MSVLKPNHKQQLLCQHRWKLDQNGQPMVGLFSRTSFKNMTFQYYEGKKYPSMGWKVLEEWTNGRPNETTPTPPEAAAKPSVSDELEAKVKEAVEKDNQRGVTIPDIEMYAKGKGYEIDMQQPKKELFAELKDIVNSEI